MKYLLDLGTTVVILIWLAAAAGAGYNQGQKDAQRIEVPVVVFVDTCVTAAPDTMIAVQPDTTEVP